MGVGQLSESDAVDALRLPFYSSSHPTGSHGWRNQFDLGNPDLEEQSSNYLQSPVEGLDAECIEWNLRDDSHRAADKTDGQVSKRLIVVQPGRQEGRGCLSLANKRVQVARPAKGNYLALGVVGTAYPAVGDARVADLYAVDPDDDEDLDKVEDLLFSESELELLP